MKINKHANLKTIALVCSALFASSVWAQENASDPTSSVNYTDVKAQLIDTGDLSQLGDDRTRYAITGANVFGSSHKLIYELNYWDTNVTGSDENDFESAKLKYINLTPKMLDNGVKYKFAIGAEVIVDLGDAEKGIGTGTTQFAPLIGAGWAVSESDKLITLVQYFHSVDEDDDTDEVRKTGPRIIWIHSFKESRSWIKLDNKFSINHEDSGSTSNTLEVQLGKMFTPNFGAYVEGLYGTGGAHSYDSGVGLGLRFRY